MCPLNRGGALCDRLEKGEIFAFFKPRGLVLDVGCGTGNYSMEVSRRGAKVVGIDSSFDMVLYAKRKSEKEGLDAYFVVGNSEMLPFRGGVFEGAISVTVLCFASNPGIVIAETKRVLKPSGDIVLGELNKWSYWSLLRRIKALFSRSSYKGTRVFSFKSLKGLLGEAGFKDLKWSSCIYFPPSDSRRFLRGWKFFEILGRALFPEKGAFFVVSGSKQTGGIMVRKIILVFFIVIGVSAIVSAGEEDDKKSKAAVIADEIISMRDRLAKTFIKPGIQITEETFKNVCGAVGKRVKEISEKDSVKIRHAAVKNRNSLNAATPEEEEILAKFERDKSLKDIQDALEIEGGKYRRYVKPIFIEEACLACHGPKDKRPKFIIDKYPGDKAYGFKVGDLRGMIMVLTSIDGGNE